MTKTLRIFTRERERPTINVFLSQFNIPHEIYTKDDTPSLEPFEFGASYCYPRIIKPEMLNLSRKGFVNYHPAPLPEHPYHISHELNPIEIAVRDGVLRWGCTLHYMDHKLDSGPIIEKLMFDLEEHPRTKDELGALTHWHMMKMFKRTILSLYHFSNPVELIHCTTPGSDSQI